MSAPLAPASRLVCGGCGAVPDAAEPFPFSCRNAGDGGDHVLRRVLDLSVLKFPQEDREPNPFIRFRSFSYAYHVARAHGMGDEAFVALVRRLDGEVARVDGGGFSVTPFATWPALGERVGLCGELWVKDETGNVSGSHKARHLMAVMLYLNVLEAARLPAWAALAESPEMAG